MLFSILRSTEPYLDVYFSEAANIDAELQEAGFTTVRVTVGRSTAVVQLRVYPRVYVRPWRGLSVVKHRSSNLQRPGWLIGFKSTDGADAVVVVAVEEHVFYLVLRVFFDSNPHLAAEHMNSCLRYENLG